ncbi:MAG: hypothetical protein N2544_03800 [Burkholderiales bacterium]|nr:hypothetical protein [Burkholderiales bacterium]
MASMEEIEIARYRGEIDRDTAALVAKYLRIMGWDIPEVDNARATSLVVAEVRAALDRLATAAK